MGMRTDERRLLSPGSGLIGNETAFNTWEKEAWGAPCSRITHTHSDALEGRGISIHHTTDLDC